MKSQMAEISRLSKQADKFNNAFNDEMASLKNVRIQLEEHGESIMKRIVHETENRKEHEEEIEKLISEFPRIHDRKVQRLNEYHKENLESILERCQKKVEKWKARCESARKCQSYSFDEVDKEKKDLEKKYLDEQETIKGLKNENDCLIDQVSKIQNKNKKLSAEIKELKSTFSRNDHSSKEIEISRLKQEIKNLKHESSVHHERLKEARKEQNEDAMKWKEKYDTLRKDYDRFKNDKQSYDMNSNSKDVNYYIDELRVANIEINSFKRKLETKAGVMDTLHETIRKNGKLISELEEKLSDEQENVKKCNHKVELYKNELEEKKDELEDKATEIKRLESELNEKSRIVSEYRKDKEVALENEKKWNARASRMEERVECLLKEIEECKRLNASLIINNERKQTEFEKIKKDKSRIEKQYSTLKELAEGLEKELEVYHSKITDIASSKKELVKEKGSWSCEVDTLKKDLDKALKAIKVANENRDELETLLSYKDIELEDEKSEINYLKERLENEKIRCMKLEEDISEYQRADRDVDILRQQLLSIKEESSNHITRVTTLEREKYCLSEKYNAAKEKERELRKRLKEVSEKLEDSEKKIKDQKKVFEEQEAQQMKLIEFLQKQNEENEKKRKPFLSINSKLVGEEGSKALKAEQDKNRRINEELDGLRKDYDKALCEVQQLKSQLVGLHNKQDQAMFSEMPCKFNHDFDIVAIENSIFRKCFKCGKKLYKSARKCRKCSIMSHVDCKIEAETCGVGSLGFERDTLPINSDGSSIGGSSQDLDCGPSAPLSTSDDEIEHLNDIDRKLKEMQDKFYMDNNLSPSKRKSAKLQKNAKRNKPNMENLNFSDSIFNVILK